MTTVKGNQQGAGIRLFKMVYFFKIFGFQKKIYFTIIKN